MLGRGKKLPKINFKLIFLITAFGSLYWFLYIWRLGSLTPGLSITETAAAADSTTWQNILNNPTYAPHKLLQFGSQTLIGSSAASLRLASVIFAAIFIICFYLLASKWFGRLIGLVMSLFFAAMPWMVIGSRSATPFVLLLAPLAVLSSYHWLGRAKRWLTAAYLVFSITTAASLYIPGMVWILLFSLIFSRKVLWFNIKRVKIIYLFLGILFFGATISPLVYVAAGDHDILRQIALLPANLPAIDTLIKNVGWSLSALFMRAPEHFEWLVGRIPILSAVLTALVLFGTYAMSVMAAKKLYLMISLLIYGVFMAGLNDNLVYLTFAIVPLLIIAAAGLRFLFLEWQNIFPKNPIPRHFAYGLMLLLALSQVIYGANYTISAWPNTPETKATYMIK